jgi:hypothetical protein
MKKKPGFFDVIGQLTLQEKAGRFGKREDFEKKKYRKRFKKIFVANLEICKCFF